MDFRDLLAKKNIPLESVLILRHRPQEPQLRKVFPWLAETRHDVFNAYQRAQVPKVEKAFTKAAYIASFIGVDAGEAFFAGLYKIGSSRRLNKTDFHKIPENRELFSFGMIDLTTFHPSPLWFDLDLDNSFYNHWRGRLIIKWPAPERVWCRWADSTRNEFDIKAILHASAFEPIMPKANKLVITAKELALLPKSWKHSLKEWRGVYFIWDSSDGKSYVGSAYGSDNILGRWQNYLDTGHGGNVDLRSRDPQNFQFSILERVSPDMPADEVIAIENTWKDRLHTRSPSGLNKN